MDDIFEEIARAYRNLTGWKFILDEMLPPGTLRVSPDVFKLINKSTEEILHA